MTKYQAIIAMITVLALSACTGQPAHHFDDAQYWQRVSASDAIHTQGPKAQQMLNRSIGQCVSELKELERLGAIKEGVPTAPDGRVMNSDELALLNWDTPERDGSLRMEHGDYQDFEGCMRAKGWERVLHVPFKVAHRAQVNYYRAHVDYDAYAGHEDKIRVPGKKTSKDGGDYANLND